MYISRDKEKWSDKWGYEDNEKQEEHIENKDREGGGGLNLRIEKEEQVKKKGRIRRK
jgi:hypothetical protein